MNDELRRALRRVEPPAGFADRVLRAVKAEPASPKRPKAAKAGWAIAATLMIATVSGGLWYRAEERRKQEGEEAKRQVLFSLGLAGSKLRSIEMKVNHGEGR